MQQKSEPLITHSVGERGGELGGCCGTTSAEHNLTISLKTKNALTFPPSNSTFRNYLQDITYERSDMYTRLFIVLLFIMAKILETT